MTDFLTRLAERTFGLAPQVQPVLSSRYASGAAVPTFSEAVGEERVGSPKQPASPFLAAADRSRDGAVSAVDPVPPHATPEMPAASATSTAVASASRPSEQAIPLDSPESVSSRVESHSHGDPHGDPHGVSHRDPPVTRLAASTAVRETPVAIAAAEAGPSQQLLIPSSTGLERQTELAWNEPLSVPPARVANVRSKPIVPANPQTRHGEELPAVEPRAKSGPQPAGPPEPIRVQIGGRGDLELPVGEIAAPRADAARANVVLPLPAMVVGLRDSDPAAIAAGPPVIRVTIGRIEVRAISPPTPGPDRPAPTRATPALSLDAYLKQHNEGRR